MDEFSNLKSKLLAEQVQDQLFRYILNTPVPVGNKLPNEFELGQKFGVGRSTIREAVKLLVSRKVLAGFGNLCNQYHTRRSGSSGPAGCGG